MYSAPKGITGTKIYDVKDNNLKLESQTVSILYDLLLW